jgi:hypothetical protein
LLAGPRKFAIQAFESFMDSRHVGFEVNGFNEDLNLAGARGVLPCEWSLAVYGTPVVIREADRKPQAVPCKKNPAGSCDPTEHNQNAIAR